MVIRFAITVAGAVSLGSYEAGVLYEILDALAQHNAGIPDDQKNLVDVLTGASAGEMRPSAYFGGRGIRTHGFAHCPRIIGIVTWDRGRESQLLVLVCRILADVGQFVNFRIRTLFLLIQLKM
jgi:hypothetical protein